MMIRVLRGLAGLAILAVGLFVMNGLIGLKETPAVNPRTAAARAVKGMPVTNGALSPEVAIEGRVQAMNRMTILSEVSGLLPVGGKEFREGVSFGRNEAMVRLNDAEPRATLVAQRSQWLQLLASMLADVQADFPDRSETWRGFVQSIDVEVPVPDLPEFATERERLYFTGRGVVSGYHNLLASEERLSKFTLAAPFDGVVTQALVQPGSMVRAGQPLGTFVGTGAFEVKSAVHARHLSVLSPGDAVSLVQEDGATVATGQVSRISGNVDPTTQSASVFCEVRAVSGQTLRDGRFLSGVVQGRSQEARVAIDEALIEGEAGQEKVFVIRDGMLALTPVRVVHKDRDQALVSGLEDGAVLLAEPMAGAYEGMLVEVIEP